MGGDLAPGLSGDWLNGWLAAVGSTVLVPGLRLAWTPTPRPIAQLTTPDDKPAARSLAEAFPTREDVHRLSIARNLDDSRVTFGRKITYTDFVDRAAYARRMGDLSLGVTVTDLTADVNLYELPHSPLDPPAPKGVTLWDRLLSLVDAVSRLGPPSDLESNIWSSMTGNGSHVEMNGLGFDYRRLIPPTEPTDRSLSVDPIIEILAFYGILLFPFRGNGWTTTQLGWYRDATSGRSKLIWPVWERPLDRWAVDALLDVPPSVPPSATARGLGVLEYFESVRYSPRSSADSTRAVAARRSR